MARVTAQHAQSVPPGRPPRPASGRGGWDRARRGNRRDGSIRPVGLKDRWRRVSLQETCRLDCLQPMGSIRAVGMPARPGAAFGRCRRSSPALAKFGTPADRGSREPPASHYAFPASSAAARSRVFAPGSMSSMGVNSSSQWLRPPREGTKIMPVGAMAAMYCASWPAPESMRR